MNFAHSMPFGATFDRGATRFRLWAPAARNVTLLLGAAGAQEHALVPKEDGWYEARIPDIGPGTRYAYRIDGGHVVPDPASRWNPDGVHAPSVVVDPGAHAWAHGNWQGRVWNDAVLYELHVGTFTPEGTFAAAAQRFADLAALGVTAVELMPVAAFAGRRNWGYDGVLPFAPACAYGTPDDLKRLVDAAHACGLMVLLDVVYNHFGPEGNYLHLYAPQFFNPGHQTPWGAAVNFDGAGSRTVRDFFIHNALYWLAEFRFDGLRLDAVHAIVDDSQPDFVTELAAAVHRHAGSRQIHLVLENDHNSARRLRRDRRHRPIEATAQWNDDIHHALHVLVTQERDGYYEDYAQRPLWHLGRCLAEGFAYQGEASPLRGGKPRGEPSASLPAGAFVAFTQTHDQVGNRAFGERLVTLAPTRAVRAAVACVLLSPSPPMLFMGEEFGATSPFLYFCDFDAELASAVTRGRREEFARFARFCDPVAREAIPDPNAPATFLASKLDWAEAAAAAGVCWRMFYAGCLALRREHIQPRLDRAAPGGRFEIADAVLRVRWALGDGTLLHLGAHFGATPAGNVAAFPGMPLYESDPGLATGGTWPAHAVVCCLEDPS